MRFLVKQKIFSWNSTYDIYDGNLEPKYFVEAEVFSFGHQIRVYNKLTKSEVGVVRQRISAYMPQYDIEIEGIHKGSVSKQFTFVYPNYIVSCNDWQIKGDFAGGNYELIGATEAIMNAGHTEIDGTTYVTYDINNTSDVDISLLLALAIEAVNY